MSDNYLAEHLLKTLGAELNGEGTFSSGVQVVRQTLASLGIPLGQFEQIDGSGLARVANGGNRATPRAINALLRTMAHHPTRKAYIESLPIAGEKGSLSKRFTDAPFRGRVIAKTGYINGALTLSGYIVGDETRVVTFTILSNDDASTFERREQVRQFQNAALTAIWEYLPHMRSDIASVPELPTGIVPVSTQ